MGGSFTFSVRTEHRGSVEPAVHAGGQRGSTKTGVQVNSVCDTGEGSVVGFGDDEQRGSTDPGKQSGGHLGSTESGV